jgi:hypothetical protein
VGVPGVPAGDPAVAGDRVEGDTAEPPAPQRWCAGTLPAHTRRSRGDRNSGGGRETGRPWHRPGDAILGRDAERAAALSEARERIGEHEDAKRMA